MTEYDPALTRRPSAEDLALIPCEYCRDVMRSVVRDLQPGRDMRSSQAMFIALHGMIRTTAHGAAGHTS